MPSLSERAYRIAGFDFDCDEYSKLVFLVAQMAEVVESLTEARVAASNKIERMELRIEELEAQLAQLTPPKDIGPVVKPVWQKISESDLPAEGM